MNDWLRCCDCGCVFPEDEAGVYSEPHYFADIKHTFYEAFICCPECGGDSLEEAEMFTRIVCTKCGRTWTEEEAEDMDVCPECGTNLVDEYGCVGDGNYYEENGEIKWVVK